MFKKVICFLKITPRKLILPILYSDVEELSKVMGNIILSVQNTLAVFT